MEYTVCHITGVPRRISCQQPIYSIIQVNNITDIAMRKNTIFTLPALYFL